MKRIASLHLCLFAGWLLLCGVSNAQSSPFPDGANALFAGHSFFIPVAGSFNRLAEENGFSNHSMATVFRGGGMGSPQRLWEDPEAKQAIIEVFESQPVELFGLTTYGEELNDFEDFQQWFDLALTYNPDIHFYIGQPWGPAGPSVETQAFADMTVEMGETTFATVEKLREAYPNNPITFFNYGVIAPLMKSDFESGSLPDIEALVFSPDSGVSLEQSLFSDGAIGHAGPMMTELCALIWLAELYGANLQEMVYTEYLSDVEDILNETLEFNEPYREDFSNALIPGAKDLGEGYYYSSWFGLYADYGDYIYSYEHGWLYVRVFEEEVYLYDQELGWLWTNRAMYPYLYSFSSGDYLYYQEGYDLRYFYDFAASDWKAVPKN